MKFTCWFLAIQTLNIVVLNGILHRHEPRSIYHGIIPGLSWVGTVVSFRMLLGQKGFEYLIGKCCMWAIRGLGYLFFALLVALFVAGFLLDPDPLSKKLMILGGIFGFALLVFGAGVAVNYGREGL